jgi:hypothetical protein
VQTASNQLKSFGIAIGTKNYLQLAAMFLQPFDLFFIAFTLAMFMLTVVLSNVLFKQEKKVQLGDTSEETRKYIRDIRRMRRILVVVFAVLILVYAMYHYSKQYVK